MISLLTSLGKRTVSRRTESMKSPNRLRSRPQEKTAAGRPRQLTPTLGVCGSKNDADNDSGYATAR